MKILVFSDSHRSVSPMIRAVEREIPDHLIHLGDLEDDADLLGQAFPRLPLVSVPGNCDGWSCAPLQKLITLSGVPILLSHGHIWQVKKGESTALYAAAKAGAQILLFGHTHRPVCRQEDSGLWVLNPGPARSSYGVIEIHQGKIQCSLHPAL